MNRGPTPLQLTGLQHWQDHWSVYIDFPRDPFKILTNYRIPSRSQQHPRKIRSRPFQNDYKPAKFLSRSFRNLFKILSRSFQDPFKILTNLQILDPFKIPARSAQDPGKILTNLQNVFQDSCKTLIRSTQTCQIRCLRSAWMQAKTHDYSPNKFSHVQENSNEGHQTTGRCRGILDQGLEKVAVSV